MDNSRKIYLEKLRTVTCDLYNLDPKHFPLEDVDKAQKKGDLQCIENIIKKGYYKNTSIDALLDGLENGTLTIDEIRTIIGLTPKNKTINKFQEMLKQATPCMFTNNPSKQDCESCLYHTDKQSGKDCQSIFSKDLSDMFEYFWNKAEDDYED